MMQSSIDSPALMDDAIPALRAGIRGTVLVAADAGYDVARRVWNGMVDKSPLLIVQCASVADVIAAVQFARAHALLVAVRGGGHNVAGMATCDGGMVIDLTLMQGVRVDPMARRVRAEGGVTWGRLDRETQVFGLATTGGLVSTTGIAGLTLGGGIGWLARSHGLSCDNVLSADVVTADGQLIVADARHHKDLWWGIRGGGGNFGIVTSFEYQLHPLGPTIMGGMVLHPVARAREMLSFYRDYLAKAPTALSVFPAFISVPPLPMIPAELHGTPALALAACYLGSPQDAERVMRPLQTFGPPIVDLLGLMPYTTLQSMFDDTAPFGVRSYWKTQYLPRLSDACLNVLLEHTAQLPSLFPLSTVHVYPMGGAITRIGATKTAFAARDAQFVVNIIAEWFDPAATDRHIQWVRGLWEALRPHASGGTYLNFLGDEGVDAVASAYGVNYPRLARLKKHYDPTNFFRLNHNIKPR